MTSLVLRGRTPPWAEVEAGGGGQVVNSELCAGDTWRLSDGSETLGLGHCQPLLCDFAPLGLGGTDLPSLPKEEPAAIWHYLQLAWNLVEPEGKWPSVPAGAPWRQLLFCHIPGCRGCRACGQVCSQPRQE